MTKSTLLHNTGGLVSCGLPVGQVWGLLGASCAVGDCCFRHPAAGLSREVLEMLVPVLFSSGAQQDRVKAK